MAVTPENGPKLVVTEPEMPVTEMVEPEGVI